MPSGTAFMCASALLAIFELALFLFAAILGAAARAAAHHATTTSSNRSAGRGSQCPHECSAYVSPSAPAASKHFEATPERSKVFVSEGSMEAPRWRWEHKVVSTSYENRFAAKRWVERGGGDGDGDGDAAGERGGEASEPRRRLAAVVVPLQGDVDVVRIATSAETPATKGETAGTRRSSRLKVRSAAPRPASPAAAAAAAPRVRSD